MSVVIIHVSEWQTLGSEAQGECATRINAMMMIIIYMYPSVAIGRGQ